jgi:probable rRNA maturation factor
VSNCVSVFNRQRTVDINRALLQQLSVRLLTEELCCPSFEIGVFLVGEKRIAELNEHYVRHTGPTDVITFDYTDEARRDWLGGDIFVCVPVALRQAAQFRAPWQKEILRYIIHGVLHLRGMDDHTEAGYRRMKREENRLLKRLAPGNGLSRLGKER